MTTSKQITLSILIILSVILLVVYLVWFMFGNSPTSEQLAVVLVLPVYLFMFGIYERLNNKIMNTRESIHRQMGDIRVTLAKIEEKLTKK